MLRQIKKIGLKCFLSNFQKKFNSRENHSSSLLNQMNCIFPLSFHFKFSLLMTPWISTFLFKMIKARFFLGRKLNQLITHDKRKFNFKAQEKVSWKGKNPRNKYKLYFSISKNAKKLWQYTIEKPYTWRFKQWKSCLTPSKKANIAWFWTPLRKLY